jgi:hypothetical protein
MEEIPKAEKARMLGKRKNKGIGTRHVGGT